MLGKYNTQNIMEIINDGDEIGFTLEIEALEDARSPTLYNADTDEYMQITGDILAGDIITVTTKTGHKTVTLDRGGVKTNVREVHSLNIRLPMLVIPSGMMTDQH